MSGLKELVLTKDYFLELVERWQSIWMNQKQNSKEDYENYWRRAFRVDANMRHHLADMIAKDPLLLALVEIAETLESLGEYAANIQRNHPDECAHGAGYSLLGQLAQQVNTDAYHALNRLRAMVEGK